MANENDGNLKMTPADGQTPPPWAQTAPPVEMAKPEWTTISVSHAKRKANVHGVEQEIDVSIVLMCNRKSGDMKTWEAQGHFELEDLQKAGQ